MTRQLASFDAICINTWLNKVHKDAEGMPCGEVLMFLEYADVFCMVLGSGS